MTRLVIFVPTQIGLDHPFVEALSRAKINPERVTFASADGVDDLIDVMTAESAEFGLLAGMSQLNSVRPDLTTKNACGRPFIWGIDQEWGFLATIHPEALARNTVWTASVDSHLQTLVAWGRAPADLIALAPTTCVSCNETRTTLDHDLLPWCATHG